MQTRLKAPPYNKVSDVLFNSFKCLTLFNNIDKSEDITQHFTIS